MTVVDPRYPVGKFQAPETNTAEVRAEHIETLRQLPERLRAAVSGLTSAQLDTAYRDGGWTVRQVVHHLADSHANSVIRFKLALTEDWPTIKAYNETAWAELPDSKSLAIDSSIVFIESMHARWVALLESMSEADFARGMVHPERGRSDLAMSLAIYAWHSLHHVAHIACLRERMGW
ncbi:MAG TPA: putative metal-dependent hydrolase [Terracidiphilus sp.]|nr:putative metal-dependent hydrolase [Terracidiphilus sp.]